MKPLLQWLDNYREFCGLIVLVACALCSLSAQAQNATTTKYEYDAQGNLKKITDPRDKVTDLGLTIPYDALNRLREVVQPSPLSGDPRPTIKYDYDYDALDRLEKVTDPKALLTTYRINGLGNLASQISPDTKTTSFPDYDAAGNLKKRVNALNKETSYTYDAINRVKEITFSDTTPPIIFGYDEGPNAKGKLSGMQDAAGTTLWGYDDLGRVNSKSQTQGGITKTVLYVWGQPVSGVHSAFQRGHLTAIGYPSGLIVYRERDNAGRLGALYVITPNPGSQTIGLFSVPYFSPLGLPTATVWWDNLTPVLARLGPYDVHGRPAYYTRDSDIRVLVYDNASRIKQVLLNSNQAEVAGYEYDDLNRLIQWRGSSTTVNLKYDISGDITDVNYSPSPAYQFTYTNDNTSHWLASINTTPQTNFVHQDTGNMISSGSRTFEYDARVRMTKSINGSVTTTYAVNGLGQRVRKTVDSGPSAGTTYFVYDEEGHLLGEYDGNGNVIQEYVWHNDLPVAILRGPTSSPQIYFIETDHLGTPRQVRDTNLVLRWQWDSGPYGSGLPNENPSGLGIFTLNLRFPGQYFDKETNLHYNYFRDYDPAIGRYVQSDPIGLLGGINTYGYVGGNPLTSTDPRGLQGVLSPAFLIPPLLIGGMWAANNPQAARALWNAINSSSSSSDPPSGGAIPPSSSPGDYCLQNPNDPMCQGIQQAQQQCTIPDSRAPHIFRNASGHVPDTAANRQLLINVGSNPRNLLGTDQYGNTWYAQTQANGTQVWVQVRNGQVMNGGVNTVPRTFNSQSGLASPSR